MRKPLRSPDLDVAEQLIVKAKSASREDAALLLRAAARILLSLRQAADLVPCDQ